MIGVITTVALRAIPTLVPNRVQQRRVDQVVAVVRVLQCGIGDALGHVAYTVATGRALLFVAGTGQLGVVNNFVWSAFRILTYDLVFTIYRGTEAVLDCRPNTLSKHYYSVTTV